MQSPRWQIRFGLAWRVRGAGAFFRLRRRSRLWMPLPLSSSQWQRWNKLKLRFWWILESENVVYPCIPPIVAIWRGEHDDLPVDGIGVYHGIPHFHCASISLIMFDHLRFEALTAWLAFSIQESEVLHRLHRHWFNSLLDFRQSDDVRCHPGDPGGILQKSRKCTPASSASYCRINALLFFFLSFCISMYFMAMIDLAFCSSTR